MATRTFEIETRVPVGAAVAIDFLMQLDAHRGMHAYLESAEVVASGAGADGPWWDWRVVERPMLGPLRYRIRFPARMTRRSPTSMRGSVQAAPACSLTTDTTAIDIKGGATIRELTVVTAPWLVVGYMSVHAQIAHERTFSLLATELASRAVG